jgi:hypothetical protein
MMEDGLAIVLSVGKHKKTLSTSSHLYIIKHERHEKKQRKRRKRRKVGFQRRPERRQGAYEADGQTVDRGRRAGAVQKDSWFEQPGRDVGLASRHGWTTRERREEQPSGA